LLMRIPLDDLEIMKGMSSILFAECVLSSCCFECLLLILIEVKEKL
jgi:hypothetical protein